jgi:hypothetical protein
MATTRDHGPAPISDEELYARIADDFLASDEIPVRLTVKDHAADDVAAGLRVVLEQRAPGRFKVIVLRDEVWITEDAQRVMRRAAGILFEYADPGELPPGIVH